MAAALALLSLAVASACTAGAQTITNLHQLTQALESSPRINRDVDFEATVCTASRPDVGVLIAQDETGVELLELDGFDRELIPGERIRIRRDSCLLRKREMGIEISAMPVVNNDGLHSSSAANGRVFLKAGKVPLRLECFNELLYFALNVEWAVSNAPPRLIGSSNLWHAVVTGPGATNFLPGLRAESYEGLWEALPDFNLLQPVKTGQVTNFDLSFRSRDEGIGIRYTGFLDVPRDGQYRFVVRSDDGAALFLGDWRVPVVSLGRAAAPEATAGRLMGTGMTNLDERCWTTVEGNVGFVTRAGKGVRFDLGTDRQIIPAGLADATGLDLASLQNARVRITGIGRGAMTLDQTLVLGKLFAASARDLTFVEQPPGRGDPSLPIASVARVQSLPAERARQALPVRIRGTVTGTSKTSQGRWIFFQDDSRGIFVILNAATNAAPVAGELWEVQGHSGMGDFAPIITADHLTRLGAGLMPIPVAPSWTELLNGSRDVQWAELKGLVTDVHSNTISLDQPEGRMTVELEDSFESDLKPFLKANVRIRGVLYAVWNAATHEVRIGRVMMRNATVSVDVPAPADPFDAVARTPRNLLMFDAQASAFRPVKVRGQIIYADAAQLFLEGDGTGLRLLPVDKPAVCAGDLVEAVGYPDIGESQLQLHEVLLRKTGVAPLPAPKKLEESALSQENLNSTRVSVEGKFLGWHTEEGAPVLEMQSGTRLFLARIAPENSSQFSLRPGSRLALVGVLVGRGQNQNAGNDNKSFELLLNSLADISILSQPSWWTLPRLLALVGVLLVILTFTVIWNTQLRRLAEQRTNQLQHEIRERELVEHQRALEAERSRIARDLHDDLGSSLTEISVLANTGQRPELDEARHRTLFRAIAGKARSLVGALDVIVWAVDPDDNSLQSLADYLTSYAEEFLSHTKVACRFKVPVAFPQITLEGRLRHDVLLAVKETLNNVVRHAEATEMEFSMAVDGGVLEIGIADNGKGFEGSPDGHGLKNLAARLSKLGGTCAVESRVGGGTAIKIRMPLPMVGEPQAGPTKI